MTKTLLSLIFSTFLSSSFALTLDQKMEMAKKRCHPETPSEQHVYSSDFHWNMTMDQLNKIFPTHYQSKKRLKYRAFFQEQFKIPHQPSGKDTLLTENFLKSLIIQVEEAHKRKYVDALIFPDMGHSHFFIPEKFFKEELADIDVPDYNILYQKILAHKGTRILYHTAEQLKTMEDGKPISDRYLQWRYYTRNIVGRNDQSKVLELVHEAESRANTAHNYRKGYKYWGAGFNISASIEGCFPYEVDGEIKYFDISFEDLGSGPGTVYY